MNFFKKILNFFLEEKKNNDIKYLQYYLTKIKKYCFYASFLSNDQLRNKTNEFKNIIRKKNSHLVNKINDIEKFIKTNKNVELNKKLYIKIHKIKNQIYQQEQNIINKLLPQAFAIIKETANRFTNNHQLIVRASELDIQLSKLTDYVNIINNTAIWNTNWNVEGKNIKWNMSYYDVQIMGGIVLHQGKIAEMATGEGKTLVATLPIYLNSLSGRGVHVVTVNNYLSKRDSFWMAPLMEFHGLTVDCIDNYKPFSIQRKQAYQSDITYGTNNEFGFDYLRDNMMENKNKIVQRELNYAIIDEVDSVLIDEARTPLILSGPISDMNNHDKYNKDLLNLNINIKHIITEQKKQLNKIFNKITLPWINDKQKEKIGFYLLQLHRGLPKYQPLIQLLNQKKIRDLFDKTEMRYLQNNEKYMHEIDENLFFVIDEKNNTIELTDKGVDYLSKDTHDENMFIIPDINLEIKNIKNKNLLDHETKSQIKKLYNSIASQANRIHIIHQLLRAYTLLSINVDYVVIKNKIKIVDQQTGRIMRGRRYADGLHQAIEVKENVSIQNNMHTVATITLQNYFRMYAKLSGMTGTAMTESKEFWDIYNLDVITIPRNKPLIRKDFEDLVYKNLEAKYHAIVQDIIYTSQTKNRPVLVGTKSVEISELISKMLTVNNIQHNVLNAKLHKKEAGIINKAGVRGIITIATNMAGRGTDIKITDEVKMNGGLAIIGTEKHDSRRIDLQLRGRAGRQGDPGSSQFYVSLEDNLMRLFITSDKLSLLMDKFLDNPGDSIQHYLITKSIEAAQKKIEENNFETRKRLLEYDDVLNKQRNIIYILRMNTIKGIKIQINIVTMIQSIIKNIFKLKQSSLISKKIKEIFNFNLKNHDLSSYIDNPNKIFQKIMKFYICKNKKFLDDIKINTNFIISNKLKYKSISIKHNKKKMIIFYNSHDININIIEKIEQKIILFFLDKKWKNHLQEMDNLRQSVQNYIYEQKDPLLIYKEEGFVLFKKLMQDIFYEIIYFLFNYKLNNYIDSINQDEIII